MSKENVNFKDFSEEQLIDYCKNLYETAGLEALEYQSLSRISNLYFSLYKYGITQKKLLEILGIKELYIVHRNKWSWDYVLNIGKKIVNEYGYLPPAEYLRKNGYGSFIHTIYNLGKTYADLRNELGANNGSSFVISKNGLRWRSHPEASFSNFLFTRGITHGLGRKYPDDYASFSGLRYGYYDLWFIDVHNNSIDVEIWGDKPNGHKKEFYAYKRNIKEHYNINNPNFIGLEYIHCFDEQTLTHILQPYIGVIEPFIFVRPSDKMIPSTHWSNADELIDYCRNFIEQFPDKKFPTEEWLRKRGKWKNREGEAYNTLAVYIKKWLGGVRNLRIILGQSDVSTEVWDKDKALEAYNDWYRTYGITPGSARARFKRGQIQLDKTEVNRACCIEAAVLKYIGSASEAQRILNINTKKAP